jgi:Tfp pilus assembly protein PilN
MKPAAAFSVGLWTGAAVVAAVGLFYIQGMPRMRATGSPTDNSEIAPPSEKIRALEQENARLSAELQRIRETASTLKKDLDSQSAAQQPRRIPFRQLPTVTQPAPADSEDWIEQVVAAGGIAGIPQLEEAALKNNRRALEALALLADQDQAAALTRVWRSGALTLPNLVDATRYLAATLEVNPVAEQLLRGLTTDPNIDPRVLYAVVDGLANPSFPVTLGRGTSLTTPPHSKTDYPLRIQVLDLLRTAVADENFRASADQAKIELQLRWSESAPAAP